MTALRPAPGPSATMDPGPTGQPRLPPRGPGPVLCRCRGPRWPVRGGPARRAWANSGSMINRPRLLSRRPRGATRGSGAAAGPERGRAPSGGSWDPADTGVSGAGDGALGRAGTGRWGLSGGGRRAAPYHPEPGMITWVGVPGMSRPIGTFLSSQASPRMEGDPPAGPQGPGSAARGAEQGGGSGAAGGLPTPGTRSDVPAGRGNRPVAVSVVTNSAFEGAPPPYSPPDPKSFHLLHPPFPPGFSQQGPYIYQPGPGPFPAPGFPPGPLPYPTVRIPHPDVFPPRLQRGSPLTSPPGFVGFRAVPPVMPEQHSPGGEHTQGSGSSNPALCRSTTRTRARGPCPPAAGSSCPRTTWWSPCW